MAGEHGGHRPGAGAVPKNLDDVIGYRQATDGSQVPVTYMDRIVEAISLGGFLHDAAARVGVTVETLRDWRRQGNKALADVLAGRKRRSHFTKRERQYAELAQRMETAEAEARLRLLGIGQQLAQGGAELVETIEKVVEPDRGPRRVVERTTRTSHSLPDARMVTWLLSHRWPADFAGRVELTGPAGGPVQVDTRPALDRLRQAVEKARQPTPNGHEPQPTAPTNGNHPTP
jgi:hypothetical protein